MKTVCDVIMFHGNVITMESAEPVSAIGIIGNRIACVGTDEEVLSGRGPHTRMIDLHGRTVIPGFVESHMHPYHYARSLIQVNCAGEATTSFESLRRLIAENCAARGPGKWVVGRGWDEAKMQEKRRPTRCDIDSVCPDNPVFLARVCGHVQLANSRALQMAGITRDTENPEGGAIEKDPVTGEPTGILMGTARGMLPVEQVSPVEVQESFHNAQRKLNSYGITTANDMACTPFDLSGYLRLLAGQELTLRIRFWPLAKHVLDFTGQMDEYLATGLPGNFGSDMLKLAGLKFFVDGSIGGRTAAMTEDYEGDPGNRGLFYSSEEELCDDIARTIRNGMRVAIHAIGDAGIEVAVKALERGTQTEDQRRLRNRIDHCVLPSDDHIERIRALNAVVCSSTGFLYSLGDAYFMNLGKKRAERAFPHQIYKEKGVVAPINADCPVCPANPFLGIYSAVARRSSGGYSFSEDQALTVEDALRAYTIDAAYATFDEGIIGSIRPGKYADIAVLSDNPFTVSPEQLTELHSVLTVMNGVVVYDELS